LKEEALGRTLWIIRFGTGYGPVARQQTIISNYVFMMTARVLCPQNSTMESGIVNIDLHITVNV